MRLPGPPQLRSPLARAVVPVVAGMGLLALIGLALWGVAALISTGSAKTTDRLASSTFTLGAATGYAAIVAADGPLIFPDLLGTDGDRTVVLDHTGTDPTVGWVIRLAHPADRPISCKVTQVRLTRNFTDCEGRVIPVEQLAPPATGIAPDVSRDGTLSLDLIPEAAAASTAGLRSSTKRLTTGGVVAYVVFNHSVEQGVLPSPTTNYPGSSPPSPIRRGATWSPASPWATPPSASWPIPTTSLFKRCPSTSRCCLTPAW